MSLTVFFIVLISVIVQTVSGFGMGLIAMPIFVMFLGIDIARPLIVLIAATSQTIILLKLRKSLTYGTLGVLAISGLVGIPIGNWIVEAKLISDNMFITLLAIILISYSLYSLFAPILLELKTDRWMGVFGLFSGVLSGAYNVGGPPLVIYANARRWSPDQLRSNVQGVSLFRVAVLFITHAVSHNFTSVVLQNFMWSIPAIIIGLLAGFRLHRHIPEARFRQVIFVLLLLMGFKMLFDLYL